MITQNSITKKCPKIIYIRKNKKQKIEKTEKSTAIRSDEFIT